MKIFHLLFVSPVIPLQTVGRNKWIPRRKFTFARNFLSIVFSAVIRQNIKRNFFSGRRAEISSKVSLRGVVSSWAISPRDLTQNRPAKGGKKKKKEKKYANEINRPE